jgi:hypothetical protein
VRADTDAFIRNQKVKPTVDQLPGELGSLRGGKSTETYSSMNGHFLL